MFTENQLLAINEPTKNILVSAAAGSGKTTVLAERIINKIILDKINIDSLLVVTFTNSSASDMKERIIKKINEALNKNPDDKFLKEQLTRINKAQISTIDSFCLRVVKNNFKYLDIDPNFRIGDSGEIELLKLETLEEFLEEFYEKQEDDFISTINAFTKKADDKAFINVLLDVYDNSQNMPYPNEWLKQAYNQFNIFNADDYINSEIFQQIILYSKVCLEDLGKIFQKIKCISTGVLNFDNINNNNNNNSMESFLYKEFNIYNNLLENIKNKNYRIFLNDISSENLTFERWKTSFKKEYPNLDDFEKLKDLRNTAKDIIVNLQKKFFSKSIDNILNDNKKIYPIMKNFCELIINFDKYYLDVKKDRKIFSFSDIPHFCLDLLIEEDGSPSHIAKQYQNTFEEIIIDEYQDSNSIQETILSSISKNNRFMVGDIKQCIYIFRQANPKIFNQKYLDYFNDDNPNNKRIDLNANFRSNQNVVNAINLIFENIMTKQLGEVEYDDYAKLYFKANIPENNENHNISSKCELAIIDCSSYDEDNSNDEDISNNKDNSNNKDISNNSSINLDNIKSAEVEAHYIAQKIKSFFDENIFVNKNNMLKEIEYSDIVILMRSSTNFDMFSKILEEYNIPCFSSSSKGFYDFLEIKTILNVLRILDNPLQDVPLISVMYSAIFNFTANELLEIKLYGKNKIFWQNILNFKYLDEENPDLNSNLNSNFNKQLQKKCSDFLEKIKYWQILSKTFTINELLSFIYQDSNYYNYLGLLKNGNIRQANLMSLLEKALNFEHTSLNGLFGFISYVDKIKKFSVDGEVSLLSEDENVVRIMTIHKSKGLEFPIVFLANINKKINTSSLNNNVLFDETFTLGCSVYVDTPEEKNTPRKNVTGIQKSVLANKLKEEYYSEEMRILYVALTRAKEKLILTGCIKKTTKNTIQNILNNIENLIITDNHTNDKQFLYSYFLQNALANNYLGWVYSAIKNFDNSGAWDISITKKEEILQNKSRINTDKLLDVSKTEIFKNIFNICNINIDDIDDIDLDLNINNNNLDNRIINNLNWQHKDNILQNLDSTLSVSEIKKVYNTSFLDTDDKRREKLFEMPKFYTDMNEDLLPTEIGTTYHKVLENIDFTIEYNNNLNSIFESLLSNNLVTQREIDALDVNKLLSFLNSPMVQRIKNSSIKNINNIKRETVFTIGISPSEIYSDEILKEFDVTNNTDATILVSGIIDLYFEEDDYIILVDYKSDKIKSDKIFIDTYKPQLSIYKKALEYATNKKVKECYIYSILNEKAIPIIFD